MRTKDFSPGRPRLTEGMNTSNLMRANNERYLHKLSPFGELLQPQSMAPQAVLSSAPLQNLPVRCPSFVSVCQFPSFVA